MPAPAGTDLGAMLASMIQGTDDPMVKAALQARLSPQPLEPEAAPSVRSLTPQPQPVETPAEPVLRALPPGWGETVGMSAMVAPPAQAMSPLAAFDFARRRKPQEIV